MSNERDSAQIGLKIGRTLEQARKERGLSLGEVEQATKIRARYLRELERENFEVLPPVYVQGSLKTYANFLGLDGEVLTRELRRRQPLEIDTEAPTQAEPPKGYFLERYLISRGAAGVADQQMAEDEGDAEAAPAPADDNRRLYLVSGVFLVLILVSVALVLTLAKGSRPEVSQVREPLVSQAPSQVSHAGDGRSGPAPKREHGGSVNPQPDQSAGRPDKDARDEAAGKSAQDPSGATAIASAPPAAETATAEPAAAETATAEPTNTESAATPTPTNEKPAPTTTRPAPAPSERPARNDQGPAGAAGVEGPPTGHEGPPAGHEDGGPVKSFSVTQNTTVGATSSPRGTSTSGSCSQNGGGLEVLQDNSSNQVCLTTQVGGGGVGSR